MQKGGNWARKNTLPYQIKLLLPLIFCFRVYYGHCVNLFDSNKNNTDKIQCTDECRKSLEQWKDPTSPYNQFAKVKCGFSESCLAYKNRFKRCVNKKIRPILHKNYLLNGCGKFYQSCEKDSKCKLALNEFYADCNELINGYECTTGCKTALRNLESVAVGESLTSCQCDGTSQYEGHCLGIKRNIKKLCTT